MPVIQTVLDAPATSPLLEIDTNNIADFLVHLSHPTEPNVSTGITNYADTYMYMLYLSPARS